MCVFGGRGEIVHKSKLIRKKNCIPLNVNQRSTSHLQQGPMGSYAQAIVSLSGRRQAGTRGASFSELHRHCGMWADFWTIYREVCVQWPRFTQSQF